MSTNENLAHTAASEQVPYGNCPNCHHHLPISEVECPKCKAMFGLDSKWIIKPIETFGPQLETAKHHLNDANGANGTKIQTNDRSVLDPSLGVMANLLKGNYGLSMTYWGAGVGGGIIISGTFLVLAYATKSNPVIQIGLLCMLYWTIFVSISIWQAATKYQGRSTWSLLAKIAVVLGLLKTISATIETFSS